MSSNQQSSTPPDGRRAGAAWVAATGAFLLVAAATVFIAVRWDEVPEAAKLALVGALTGAFLAGGRALRRTLPATGDVLFHLGAFLVPVDVAGLCLRLDLGWRIVLVAEGAVGVAVLGSLAATGGSVVLAWGAAASVVVLAGGIAAITPVPAPLLFAAAAVVASLLQRHRLAVAWAAAAGLAPVTGALVTTALLNANGPGPGVLEELGLGGRTAALLAVVSSAVAAVVIGREAVRRHDLSLVALAGVCLTTGAATTWVNASPPREVSLLAGPALFLLVQAVTMLSQRDPFWGRPARALALGSEAFAALVAAPLALAFVLVAPFADEGFDLFSDGPGWIPEPAAGLAWALLAVGWLLASWRRQDAQPSPLAALGSAVADPRTLAFLTTAAVAALVVGTGSTIATAVGLLAMAVGLVLAGSNLAQPSRRAAATAAGAACALWAPFVVAVSHPLASLPVALGGAAVLGLAALPWASVAKGWVSAQLATAGSLLGFCGCAIAREEIGLPAAMLTAVTTAWALAFLVERVSPLAANVVRASMAAGVAGALGGSFTEIAAVATAATLLFALDAARHDEPLIGLGAGVGATLMVGAASGAAGLGAATSGLVLCSSAAAFAGLALVYPERWRPPFLAGAAATLTAGLPLAATDPARLAECLLVVGGLGVLAGVLTRNGILGHIGGGVAIAGLGLHLTVDGVTASEAFVAPVALQLLVAGWQLRRRADPPSSWVAFGPAIALLGAAALAERLSGGEAWHSLVAGAVGVAAVAAGGWLRLAGPLFLGTGLLVAVTVLESLNTLAGIPTWGWLALGGTTLLATGIALERTATSPVEAGRRLVDVVEQRFS